MVLNGIKLDEKHYKLDDIMAFEEHRRKFIKIFNEIRQNNPDLSLKEIGRLVMYKSLIEAPKSRAYRLMQATSNIVIK